MLSINDFVVISLYMSVNDGSVESLNACIDALSSITNVLELWLGKYVFFTGDFNVNLSRRSKQSILIQEFMSIFDLLPGDLIASTLIQCDNSTADANNMYTFCNEKRGYFSKIDYICYSSALKDFVKSY